jgi:hypothetical protein
MRPTRLLLSTAASILTATVLTAPEPAVAAQLPYSFHWGTTLPSVTVVTDHAGDTATDPYSGSGFAAVTAPAGGSIYQDHTMALNVGDTLCATAEVVTVGTATGAGAGLALFLLGGVIESSQKVIRSLPNGDQWQQIGACVTATTSHSGFRIQISPVAGEPTVGVDDVDTHIDLARNGGFNNGLTYWSLFPSSNWATYSAGGNGTPWEGSQFAATNTTATTGGIYQDIPYTVNAGTTVCASAELATQSTATGAHGVFQITLLSGGSYDYSQDPFANLPSSATWTPVSTCVAATTSRSTIRVEIKPDPGAPTVIADDVDVHLSLVNNGGFDTSAASWNTFAPTVVTSYGPGVIGIDPHDGAGVGVATPGHSIYQDLAVGSIGSLCASAQLASAFASPATGYFAVWDSASGNEIGSKPYPILPTTTWTPLHLCMSDYGTTTTWRIEYYINTGILALDTVDIHPSLAANSGMELPIIG